MGEREYAVRRVLLAQWARENERSLAWVARRIGVSWQYLTDVMRGRRGFTDRLARRLHDALGIKFDYQDPIDSEPLPAETEQVGADAVSAAQHGWMVQP
jgi:hypothetical protein